MSAASAILVGPADVQPLDVNWKRRISLTVLAQDAAESFSGGKADALHGLDLSDLRIKFEVKAGDYQSPNNAAIRVYNLANETADRVEREFDSVVLKAGYEQGAFGIVFAGDIKQVRRGRETPTETYLDILAADGDLGYNFGVVNRSWPAGSTSEDHVRAAVSAMKLPLAAIPDFTGSNLPRLSRGRVGFGMARDLMQQATDSLGASWSIQNGAVQVIEESGYLPGEAVEVNQYNGMVGVPEQTEEGIRVLTLMNSKLRVGGLLRLNTASINRLVQKDPGIAPMPYNQRTGIAYASKIAEGADGLYRAYVIDHRGDTRGREWYSEITCLLVNQGTGKVSAAPEGP